MIAVPDMRTAQPHRHWLSLLNRPGRVSLVRGGIAALCIISALAPPVPQGIGPLELAFMGVFALLALWGILHRDGPRPLDRGDRVLRNTVVGFLLVLFASGIMVFFNPELLVGDWVRGLIPFLGIALFFTGRQLIRAEDATHVLFWLTVTAAIDTAIGLRQVNGSSLSNVQAAVALRGTLDSRIFDPICVAIPPALLTMGLLERGRTRYLLLIAGIGFLAANLLSFMRSTIVVFAITVAVFMVLALRNRNARRRFQHLWADLVLVGLLTIVLHFAVPDLLARVTSPARLALTTIAMRNETDKARSAQGENYRVLEFQTAIGNWWRRPLFGQGLGASYEIYRDGVRGLDGGINVEGMYTMRYTHNIFSYFLYTTGLIGIIALCCLVYRTLRLMVQVMEEVGYRLMGADAALAAFLLSMLIYAQFQARYRASSFFMMFGLALGVLAGRLYAAQHNSPLPEQHHEAQSCE